MEKDVVHLPYRIETDGATLEYILSEFYKALSFNEERITFDFSKTNWMNADLSVLLGILIEKAQIQGRKVYFRSMTNSLAQILSKNGFLSKYKLADLQYDTFGSTIPYKVIQSEAHMTMKNYLQQDVFPNIEYHLDYKINLEIINHAVFELLQNVSDHAKSNRVYICGQFFPTKKKLELTFSDGGITIPYLVENSMGLTNDCDRIEWSTNIGNSTKENIIGGLGLYEIKNELLNIGKMTILSRNGYWTSNQNGTTTHYEITNPFPGTLVNLTFYLKDNIHNIPSNLSFEDLKF